MDRFEVAIIGAGISGLAAAVALHQQGRDVVVYEQATALVEIGAGLSVFANGLRVLDLLGVADQIEPLGAEPSELVFRHWSSGERIADEALGRGSRYRNEFGYPYLGVLRSHVQGALVSSLPADAIQLERRLVELEDVGERVRMHWSDGTASMADVVVAADGARSTVRALLFGDQVVYSGTSGFRGIIESARVPALEEPHNLQFWVGPDAHLLHFPIDPEAGLITFLAVTESPKVWPSADAWRLPCTQEEALSPFTGWHPAVRHTVNAVEHRERWALFSVGKLDHWSKNRVVLLGDAAHGMLPHHGQGANQGIEDAYVLAALLARRQGPTETLRAIAHYEEARKPLTSRVQAASWMANALLHVPDREAPARNVRFAEIPDSFRWIHKHNAGGTVEALLAEPW